MATNGTKQTDPGLPGRETKKTHHQTKEMAFDVLVSMMTVCPAWIACRWWLQIAVSHSHCCYTQQLCEYAGRFVRYHFDVVGVVPFFFHFSFYSIECPLRWVYVHLIPMAYGYADPIEFSPVKMAKAKKKRRIIKMVRERQFGFCHFTENVPRNPCSAFSSLNSRAETRPEVLFTTFLSSLFRFDLDEKFYFRLCSAVIFQ